MSTQVLAQGIGGAGPNGQFIPAPVGQDGALRVEPGDSAIDAFGRPRISVPTSIFDSKQLYEKDEIFWTESLAGGATSVHQLDEAAVLLSVSADGDKVIRQTKRYLPYTPGQSQLNLLTGTLGAPVTNTRSRCGQFDDNNGLFFERQDDQLFVVRRSSAGGSVDEERKAQSEWNIDPLDGSGPSGVTLDPSKANICLISYAWLGVGSVQMAIQIGGRVFLCHEFKNENVLDLVYMATPVLPLRYELEATGVPGSTASMKHICAAVFSEGVNDPAGLVQSANRGTSALAIGAGLTLPLISLRPRLLATARPRVTLDLLGISVFPTSAADFLVEVMIGGALTGASWVKGSENADIDISATAFSAGPSSLNPKGALKVFSQYLGASNQTPVPLIQLIESSLKPGSSIDGTAVDIITVLVTSIGAASYRGAMTWKESF